MKSNALYVSIKFKNYIFYFLFMYLNCFNLGYAQCITPEKKAEIQNVLVDKSHQYHIPGVAIAINCSSKEPIQELTYGFAQLGTDEVVTNAHLFQIGSTTKSFIAVLLT